MGIKCGIVGLPNVGKSTLFNALTQSGIEAENFPFCTIEPNTGIVAIPDPRQEAIEAIIKPKKSIPTTMEFVDIAGLVEGASKGEGLGNQFLANIRETDAIAHVVRCFTDDNVIHVNDQVDPAADIEIINTELALADLDSVEKQLIKLHKKAKGQDKEASRLATLLEKLKIPLDQALPIRSLSLNEQEKQDLKQFNLLTIKPTLYIANVSEDGFENNPLLETVKQIAASENAEVVSICNKLESEIIELEQDEKLEFLTDMGMTEPGLNRVIRGAYKLLGLQTFFTAGEKEVRAWTIKTGSTAPNAAGTIHTDFEKGFIRAETISYHDFITYKGEQGAKEAGKWRLEGKDYLVEDGDIMHFRFNV